MTCPACKNELTEIIIEDIRVDACKNGCGGLWFDWHELKKFDEPHEMAGDALLEIETNPDTKINIEDKRICPRCEETIVMMRHFSSMKKEIEVDECGNCGGFWLDAGELHNLRNQFETEEQRGDAAKQYLSALFDPMIEAERAKTQAKLEKTKKAVSAFKFICPTYYIPGEQDYGAF